MIDREKAINDLNVSKLILCNPQMLTSEMCVRIGQAINSAIELLKEQNKTIKSLTEEKERLLLERIAELQHNIDALHATMQDTILVNNAIEQRKGSEVE